jgi:ubiquitin carboxyl-terminal hydrolase 4/11/15
METFNIIVIKPITSVVSKGYQMISSTNGYQSIKEFGTNQYNTIKNKISEALNNYNSNEDNYEQENNNNMIINSVNGIKTTITNFFNNNNNDSNSFNIINPFSNIFNAKLTHLRGLLNIGSTCYMNSILQCFAHIPELHNYFKKDKISNLSIQLYDQNCLLFPIFREVIMELWNTSTNSPFEPNKFKERLGEMNPLFQGSYPNDAKDLLTFILMQLHEELNNPKNGNMNNNDYMNNVEIQKNKKALFNYFRTFFMNSYRSIISDLFYGIIYSKFQCQNCKTTFYNYKLFNFFIFPLEKVLNYKIMLNNYNNNFNNTV